MRKPYKNPLGTPTEFAQQFLSSSEGRRLNRSKEPRFRDVLRQYLVRTRRGDAGLKFPTREVQPERVQLTSQEQNLIRLVSRHIDGLNGLVQTSLAQAMMSSPAALAAQLENMAEKQTTLRDAAREARDLAHACGEPAKLRRLLTFCDELKKARADWRVVVFTLRKETQDLIGEALGRRGVAVGFIRGGQPRQNEQAIEAFRKLPPQVHVLVSTDAGSEGVNLQAGNVLVNYDLPWNPMIVEQRIGRLQRLGSVHEKVVVWNFVGAGSVEEHVVARLLEKLQGISQAMGDVERLVESTDGSGEALSFDKRIQKLVMESLKGRDVKEATRKAEESIDKAKQLLEEQGSILNDMLGSPDENRRAPLQMPKLTPAKPGMSAQEFVLRAWRADGWTVTERSAGAYNATRPGRPPEVLAFDEKAAEGLANRSVFMGNVKLYQPGKTEFERLVQHWADRCGHHVHDLRRGAAANAETLARAWCGTIPEAAYLGCRITKYDPKFQGHARVRIKATNGVDGYEKLIVGTFHPEGHRTIQPTNKASDLLLEDVQPDDVLPDQSAPLAQAVAADRDMTEFRRFYEARRAEELYKAGGDLRLERKINDDFTVSVAAEVVGIQGVRYDEVSLRVRFSVRGEGDYESTLRAIPAAGQILNEPQRLPCQLTRLRVPVECLEECQLSGKQVLKHLLFTSEESGKRGLRDRVVTCQVTKKKVLNDEVNISAASGVVALKWLFVTCEQTGCSLLPDEAAKSDYSGKLVRRDLLTASAKPSRRLGLEDEFAVCERTQRRLLLDELGRSLFGKRVDKDLLYPSARSGKLALLDELIDCQEGGGLFLPEETGVCAITKKRVDERLLSASAVSGSRGLTRLMERCAATDALALPGELEACQVTGIRVLPDQLGECSVTHSRVVQSRLAVCWKTKRLILDAEMGQSAISGVLVWNGLLKASEKPPHRLGLEEESGFCEETRKRLLIDELARCAVTGKLVDPDLLHPSARSGRRALLAELVVCQESGERFLPSETGSCAITGKTVDERLLSASAVSRFRGLTDHMQRCEATMLLALPGELEACQATGIRVLPSELGECAATRLRVLRPRLVRCSKGPSPVLDTEVARSPGGLLVWKGLLKASEKPPHRLGLEEDFGVCEKTRKRLLLDELGKSAVSGKRVDRDLLHPSARSSKLALLDELIDCQEGGGLFLPEETGVCAVTKRRVDERLLSASAVSGSRGLTRLMERCAATDAPALPGELEACQVTGVRVLPDQLGECSVKHLRVLRSRLVTCWKGQRPILDTEAGRSVSGLLVWKGLLKASQKLPHRLGLAEEFGTCVETRKRMLLIELGTSVVSRKRVDHDLLYPSDRSGGLALLKELIVCQESHVKLLPEETGTCALTKKRVDERLLSASAVSGKTALTRLMRRSVLSRKIALPDECVPCAWLGQYILRNEARGCTLTGMLVASEYLNADNELAPLRDLLDGRLALQRS